MHQGNLFGKIGNWILSTSNILLSYPSIEQLLLLVIECELEKMT